MDVANILNISPVGSPYFEYIEYSWVSFFMASFFFVSGLCSNMNKPITKIMVQGLKTLILPTLVLGLISGLFKDAALNRLDIITPFLLFKRFFCSIFNFTDNWFIQAMFIGRILYWIIVKYSKKWETIMGLSTCLFFIGVLLTIQGIDNSTYRINNCLIAVVFFAGGQYFREKGISVMIQKVSGVGFLFFL